MRNKRGLIGIIVIVLLAIILILAAGFYYQFKSDGLSFTTGNVVIKIDYNESEEREGAVVEDSNITIIEEDKNETNNTLALVEGSGSFVNLTHNQS